MSSGETPERRIPLVLKVPVAKRALGDGCAQSHGCRFPRPSDGLYNFDVHIALITNLSLGTTCESRTAPKVADELHLDRVAVKSVLEGFPCFFRQSRRASSVGEHYFEVHARCARRVAAPPAGARPLTPALDSKELSSIFDVITNMVKTESQLADIQQRTESSIADLRLKNRTLLTTTVVTMVAALLAARPL